MFSLYTLMFYPSSWYEVFKNKRILIIYINTTLNKENALTQIMVELL